MESTDLFSRGYEADRRNLPLILDDFKVRHRQEPIERPGGIPIHILVQCVKGAGEAIVDGKTAIADEGCAMLLHAGTPYSYRGLQPKWIVNYFSFSGASCESLLQTLSLERSGVCRLSDPGNLTRHFERLRRIRENAEQQPHRLLSKELYAILLDLSANVRYLDTHSPALSHATLQQVVQYIEANYAEPITLDDLARLVGLRKEYLCTLFKGQMGQTIITFLHSIRIAQARFQLVRHPEMTVREIGLACGFESASYFGRVFREYVGITPQAFRRTM